MVAADLHHQIRPIRDELERRVHRLLDQLTIPAA
jgi:hypothetical protein